jgi:LacI family transcriptional regulator
MKLRNLAHKLSLSQTTVSRALNGYSEVNETTRRRVQQIARELGFFPNANARDLAQQFSNIIAVVIPVREYFDPDFADLLDGLSEAVDEPVYDILITLCDEHNTLSSCRKIVETQRAAGIILCLPEPQDTSITFLQGVGFPFVVYGKTDNPGKHNWLDVDHQSAAFQAACFLYEQGHDSFVSFEGPRDIAATQWRIRGLKLARQQLDTANTALRIIHDDFSADSGYEQTKRLLSNGPSPTAIMFYSVRMAEGAIRAMRELGLEHRIQIIAHDNEVAHYPRDIFPPATAFTAFSIRALGLRLGRQAIGAIKYPHCVRYYTFHPRFIAPQDNGVLPDQ